MKLPDSVFAQIEAMIHSFLPYETDYEPKTPQSSLIEKLFKTVATPNPQLGQWLGFVMYSMKQIDDQPDKQKNVDTIAETAYSILSNYRSGDKGVIKKP